MTGSGSLSYFRITKRDFQNTHAQSTPSEICLNLRRNSRQQQFSNAPSLLRIITVMIYMDYKSLKFYRFALSDMKKSLKGFNERRGKINISVSSS